MFDEIEDVMPDTQMHRRMREDVSGRQVDSLKLTARLGAAQCDVTKRDMT